MQQEMLAHLDALVSHPEGPPPGLPAPSAGDEEDLKPAHNIAPPHPGLADAKALGLGAVDPGPAVGLDGADMAGLGDRDLFAMHVGGLDAGDLKADADAFDSSLAMDLGIGNICDVLEPPMGDGPGAAPPSSRP
mmetsp:Transcript_23901/g.80244  ORF Transcript_23901/g.80244 Transcript_23901/m.80244 type:complete len:134 (+) Transcript_23901:113-514(+)